MKDYEKIIKEIKSVLDKDQEFVLGETENNPDVCGIDDPVVYSMGFCDGLRQALSVIERYGKQ